MQPQRAALNSGDADLAWSAPVADDLLRPWMQHVDLDQFVAALEVLRRPELAGQPLIVGGCGDPTERALVSTASPVVVPQRLKPSPTA
jgi:DNA polymerase-4